MKSAPPFRFSVLLVGVILLFTGVIFFDLARLGLHRYPVPPEWDIEGGDVARGRQAVERFGCGACHVIPGVRQARGRVGPQLHDFSNQIFIAGRLANVPDNLILWIRDPQGVNPGTAMPNLGVTEEEARDIAAFLYSTR
jgi:cytochrome c